ncbi:MAG: LPS export ABC transporter periplasmic protein LptC [Gammaproteobacteria bacterium]
MDTPARVGLVLLAAAAAGAYWLNQQLRGPDEAPAERPARAGYYMTEAEITRPGEGGLPQYRLLAEEVRQDEMTGPTRLADVRVEYGIYTPSPWLLTAPEGAVSPDLAELVLSGGVVISGEVEGEGDTRIETPRLTVDTATHVASTSAPVRLAVGDDWLTATGMVVYLMEERLRLQSSVHGRFEP